MPAGSKAKKPKTIASSGESGEGSSASESEEVVCRCRTSTSHSKHPIIMVVVSTMICT